MTRPGSDAGDALLVRVSCRECGRIMARVVRDSTGSLVIEKVMEAREYPSGKVIHPWEREQLLADEVAELSDPTSTLQRFERAYCATADCGEYIVLPVRKLIESARAAERHEKISRWRTTEADATRTAELHPKMLLVSPRGAVDERP